MSPGELGALVEAALRGYLAGASEAEGREALEAALHCGRETRTREGKAFFYQGDKAEAALLLLEGRASPVQYRSGSRAFELPERGAGEWLGLAELVLGRAHPYDALAEEACLALAFPSYGFALARRSRAFDAAVARALAAEGLGLYAFVADEGPEERIVAFLLARRRQIAGLDQARISVTQERIARSVGVTRETVNKRLAALEARGLVRTLRGEIEVLDWERLEREREE